MAANMTCPGGGSFYACGDGSKFVGCCNADPCSASVGCAAGSLTTTTFDPDQYDELPDQECNAGLFYKCSFTAPAFWGCCSSNPCSATTGCPAASLNAAFLSDNAATAQIYLDLNATWSSPASTSSRATSTSAPTSTLSPAEASHRSSTSTGAIAGGVVGGLAILATFVFGIVWLYRRRRRASAVASDNQPRQALGPFEEMYSQTNEATKQHMTNSYTPSQSFLGSPGYSPKPPSYWSEAQARHVSYELPGTAAEIELEDTTLGNVQKDKTSP